MRSDAYTADAICASRGLPLFEHDPACLGAARALRILLMPSFHPEVCLTFFDGNVSVVGARAMIWHQLQPAPIPIDRARGVVEPNAYESLLSAAEAAAEAGPGFGVMIDGMLANIAIFRDGKITFSGERSACARDPGTAALALAIVTAWQSIDSPFCRNLLAQAGKYAGETLPVQAEPARKPVVGTMVLGASDDRHELLEALRMIPGEGESQ